jgi:hypothetical protein
MFLLSHLRSVDAPLLPGPASIGEAAMSEMVIDTKTLPEPLFRLIQAEKVLIQEKNGAIQLVPVIDNKYNCPFLGKFKSDKSAVDSFIANKRVEKELEL